MIKKITLFSFFLILVACASDNTLTNCFNYTSYNETISLNNAEFVNALTPNGFAEFTLRGRNLLLINTGTTPAYKVFDRRCPDNTCTALLSFDYPIITCPCESKEYNFLQGGAPINGEGCFAYEYTVVLINNNTLQISR